MYLNHKTYYTLNQALKEEFGEKIIKLSIDGGFTCPNRDGTIAKRGCLFCSEKGSGDFTSCADSITELLTAARGCTHIRGLSFSHLEGQTPVFVLHPAKSFRLHQKNRRG